MLDELEGIPIEGARNLLVAGSGKMADCPVGGVRVLRGLRAVVRGLGRGAGLACGLSTKFLVSCDEV